MPATSYEILRMLLPKEAHPLPEERLATLKSLLAHACNIPQDEIHFPPHKKDGLWVCVSLPKVRAQRLIELFTQNDKALQSLRAEFVIGQLNMLPVIYDSAQFKELRSDHISLIRLVYLGAERLELEQMLDHDRHDTLSILTRVLHGHGKPFVRQIVKIGSRAELRRKWQVGRQNAPTALPLIAPRLDNFVEWQGMAGMNYSFVGGGMFGQTRTLKALCQDDRVPTQTLINIIKTTLGDTLGHHWYAQNTPLVCSFAEAYSSVLVEQLRVRLRPDSADGVSQSGGSPDYLAGYRRLTGESILQSSHRLPPGELVQIRGLMVTAIEPDELTLQHPIDPGIVVRVEGASLPALSRQDRVVVRGEVVNNRQQRLIEMAQRVFAGVTDMAVDVNQPSLALMSRTNPYPNPLLLYEDRLKQTLHGRKAMVYGQMRSDAILVDQRQGGWLTGLEAVGERHALFDFIMLETCLRQCLAAPGTEPFSLADYIQFEENLTAATLGETASIPDNARLKRAFLLIDALRNVARPYMHQPADFALEYFPALFLVNLGLLGCHETIGDEAARLGFLTAAVVGKSTSGRGGTTPYSFKSQLLRQPV
ncbi:MAG: hypothetical protein KDI79_28560 [Anaerolineae bacterium]|nr:hypothetical protein [Anaerolineae bacterium]